MIAIHHALVLKTCRVLFTERLGTRNHRLAPSNNGTLAAPISIDILSEKKRSRKCSEQPKLHKWILFAFELDVCVVLSFFL